MKNPLLTSYLIKKKKRLNIFPLSQEQNKKDHVWHYYSTLYWSPSQSNEARKRKKVSKYQKVFCNGKGKDELRSLLMRVKEENEKVGLKLNIQTAKILASSHITSWQIKGEKLKTVTDFLSLDSKITADSDCSHEIKRHLLLGSKAMTNLDSTLKSRDITLLTTVPIVKAMGFPVVMYGCESWTIKTAKCQRTDVF